MHEDPRAFVLYPLQVNLHQFACQITPQEFVQRLRDDINRLFDMEGYKKVDEGSTAQIFVIARIRRAKVGDPAAAMLPGLLAHLAGIGFFPHLNTSVINVEFIFQYVTGDTKSFLISYHAKHYEDVNTCIKIVATRAVNLAIKHMPIRLGISRPSLPTYLKITLLVAFTIACLLTRPAFLPSGANYVLIVCNFIFGYLFPLSLATTLAPNTVLTNSYIKRFFFVFLNTNIESVLVMRIVMISFALVFGLLEYFFYCFTINLPH